jgi:hypothetical protein
MKKKAINFFKKFLEIQTILFYNVIYFCALNGFIHLLAKINIATDTRMPLDYLWGERYLNRIEYLSRRSKGIKCTYEDVEDEFLDEWNKRFQEARLKFEKEREKYENDWWV